MAVKHQEKLQPVEGIDLAADGKISVRRQSGEEYTYRIRSVRKGMLKGERIVELLRGPDNGRHYMGFGFVSRVGSGDGRRWKVLLWKRFRESHAFRIHTDTLNGVDFPSVERVERSVRCRMCGRVLTRISSIDAGLGPDCAGKEG
jgi:hypothetical protein